MDDVSVIIPVYNAAMTIGRAIDSAINQQGVSVQVVVCDDASTDPTRSIADHYIFDEGGRTWVTTHATNRGQCHALNTAAEHATGRYIIELDADDYLEPGALATLVHALDAAPEHIGFAYGMVQYHGALNITNQPRPYKRADFYRTFPALYPFMYRREAWDAGCRYTPHGEANGRALSIQDWDMALQLIEYMRYDGIALRETLVLHYTYAETGTVGGELKANAGVLMPAFRKRWPKVTAEGL
jgi:glycosyltransferase involved in cell wall biosynthesis